MLGASSLRKWGLFFLFLFPHLTQAQPVGEDKRSYDELFQNGLKAEATKEWSEAVQYYLLANKKAPDSPWPKERIQAVFKALQKSGQSIAALETLLPIEMSQDFRSRGIISDHYDSNVAMKNLNYSIWGGIVAALGLIFGGLFYLTRKSKKEEEEEEALRTSLFSRKAEKKAGKASEKSKESKNLNETGAIKRDVKITEKMRDEIDGIFNSVKSLSEEQGVTSDTGSVNIEALKDSGVIEAFAGSMVSEVTTEESPEGKFSKMTLEASLLFEEDDPNSKTK